MLLPHIAETRDNKPICSPYYKIPCSTFFPFIPKHSHTLSYRPFSRDVTELISAMLVHITCFSRYYKQTWSKFIVPSSLQSKKVKCRPSTEKIAIPLSDPDYVVQVPPSDYVKKTGCRSQRALTKEDLDYQNRSCFDRWETLRAWLLTAGGIDWFALLFGSWD